MSQYKEYETVRLKNGKIGSIVEVLGPGIYTADLEDVESESFCDSIYITDANIERRLTEEELIEFEKQFQF